MAFLSYSNIGIAGIAACVPKQTIDNYHYTQYFPEDVVRKVVDKIGIYERRFADENTCASDLCYAAAERLIADLQVDKNEIDVLIFISQTPGDDVFNFVASKVPKDIKRLCEIIGEDLQLMDYYLLHQANDFMNQFLVNKLKLDAEKVPSSIAKFGNTSSVSIPLTIVSELKDKLYGNKKLMLSAFGVGLSWGTVVLQTNNCHISSLIEI